jgi:hypothetical protein
MFINKIIIKKLILMIITFIDLVNEKESYLETNSYLNKKQKPNQYTYFFNFINFF